MAAARIEVETGQLSGGAQRTGGLAGELAGFRSRLGVAAGLAGAAGAPGARAAISDSCAAWGAAIEALEQQAAALDRNLQGAAAAYADTDAAAMPGSGV